MNCEELKSKILTNTLDDSFLIFVYPDNLFTVAQYVDKICETKKLKVVYAEDLTDVPADANSLFGVEDDSLFVIYDDKVTLKGEVDKYKNTIIICKEVTNAKEYDKYIVKFPKLNEEQIKEYMTVLCPGVSVNDLNWLYDITGGDIYRIYNELNKIKLFPKTQQETIFNALRAEGNFRDLTTLNIFNFIKAFMKKDYNTIKDCLTLLDVIDIECTGVVTLLLNNIKNVIDIQTDENATPNKLGVTPKQFNAIKFYCGKYPSMNLIRLYKFLTGIDYRLKSGRLELTNDQLVSYIVANAIKEATYGN